jgi:hypothetical protein
VEEQLSDVPSGLKGVCKTYSSCVHEYSTDTSGVITKIGTGHSCPRLVYTSIAPTQAA